MKVSWLRMATNIHDTGQQSEYSVTQEGYPQCLCPINRVTLMPWQQFFRYGRIIHSECRDGAWLASISTIIGQITFVSPLLFDESVCRSIRPLNIIHEQAISLLQYSLFFPSACGKQRTCFFDLM